MKSHYSVAHSNNLSRITRENRPREPLHSLHTENV